ncbi:unnamed protein product [Merluccius merluccius]
MALCLKGGPHKNAFNVKNPRGHRFESGEDLRQGRPASTDENRRFEVFEGSDRVILTGGGGGGGVVGPPS